MSLPSIDEGGIYRITANSQLPRSARYPTCASALISQPQQIINKCCTTKVYLDHPPSFAVAFSSTRILLINVPWYIAMCPETNTTNALSQNYTGCQGCVIDVTCGCYIETSIGTHHGRPFSCARDADPPTTIQHLVNLILLNAFFDSETIRHFDSDVRLSILSAHTFSLRSRYLDVYCLILPNLLDDSLTHRLYHNMHAPLTRLSSWIPRLNVHAILSRPASSTLINYLLTVCPVAPTGDTVVPHSPAVLVLHACPVFLSLQYSMCVHPFFAASIRDQFIVLFTTLAWTRRCYVWLSGA